MEGISYRRMEPEEADRIIEIDRTEEVRVGYEVRGGDLRRVGVQWDIPNFISEGEGEHTVQEQIEFCKSHLDRDGILMGAFAWTPNHRNLSCRSDIASTDGSRELGLPYR